MRAMFANLTKDDFRGRSRGAVVRFPMRSGATRRVYQLFDDLQVAIRDGKHDQVDRLLVELERACKTCAAAAPLVTERHS